MESHTPGILKSRFMIYLLAALVGIGGALTAFAYHVNADSKRVTLNDEGNTIKILTYEDTVSDVLNKFEVKLGPGDEVEPAPDSKLKKNSTVIIKRAIEFYVNADGQQQKLYMQKGKVEDAIKKAGVVLNDQDNVNYGLQQDIFPGINIVVTRVEQKIIMEKETIPYKVVTKKVDELGKDTKRIVQNGNEGQLEKEFLVVYKDGLQVSKKLNSEKITVKPVDRIIEQGTGKAAAIASRGAARQKTVPTAKTSKPAAKAKTTKSKVDTKKATSSRGSSRTEAPSGESAAFTATAYSYGSGNNTCTGIKPRPGIIAVDPRVIPLYKSVYIEFPKGWGHLNGYYKAMDTGGAIKGHIIDVFMDSESLCRNFGRRKVKIFFNK